MNRRRSAWDVFVCFWGGLTWVVLLVVRVDGIDKVDGVDRVDGLVG